MAGALQFTDQTTSTLYEFPCTSVEEFDPPAAVREEELAGGDMVVWGQADPVTGRLTRQPKWLLWIPGIPDDDEFALTSRQIQSLVLGWRGRMTALVLSGPDMAGPADEPLRREISGALANKRFWSEHGWWSSDVVIDVDGVEQTSGITKDAGLGCVTFDAAVAAESVVTATGSRSPQVRITEVRSMPLNGVYPVVYDLKLTVREDKPQ